MEKKELSTRNIALWMLAAGVVIVAAMWLLGTVIGRRDAQRTIDQTGDYLRQQCIEYRDIMSVDRVKSLMRLSEQVVELALDGAAYPQIRNSEYLAQYAQRQRMTDVLVLNGDLEIEYSYGSGNWRYLYTSSAIASIVQYPDKIFSQRVTRDGVVYDITAVARRGAPGIIFCTRERSANELMSYQTSVESLLAGYETGVTTGMYTYITDGETVIGSSVADQRGKPVDEVPLIRALEDSGDGGTEMTRVQSDGVYFGACGLYRGYRLYVFLSAGYVYAQARNMAVSTFGVLAMAILAVALLMITVNQQRKREEQEHQLRLEAEVQRATRADQAKTDFLRSMSHDIRTPINIVMGMLEIIGRSPDDRSLVEDCREKAQTAARYLLALANDVLTLNRLDGENAAPVSAPYRLSAELADIMSLARSQAEEHGVTLAEPEISLEYDEFQGNPLHLWQMIQNIVGNAIKYSHPGGQVRCRFRTARDGDGVCRLTFICEDDGVGMSEEFQKRMFDAFTQENTGRASTAEGMGLGLAVVKHIVDEHSGTIQADSARGVGTRFEINVPVCPRTAPEPEAVLDELPTLRGRRILVAEDNDLNRQIAVYLLEDAGVEVVQARDGREAVETFAASQPGTLDAVLMDMMMPRMDGLEAARAIRATERPDADIPIIAMTANLFDEDVAACLRAGMDGHIPKPLDAAQMLRTIAECIGRKHHDA